MTSAAEAANAKTPLGSALAAGIDTLSLNQEITFYQYVKLILPLDGWVFWIRASLLSPAVLKNISAKWSGAPASKSFALPPQLEIVAKGSLHYATAREQNEDATIAVNQVIFTSQAPIQEFNDIDPQTLWIAEFDGIRFAFASRAEFYEQASTWHYRGNAIYSVMEPLIIDDLAQLDRTEPIVSNSLPIWLSFNLAAPSPAGVAPPPTFPLYPSFAVPDNLAPPFAAVHILPESTAPIQGFPNFDASGSHFQLAQEDVRITLYGVRNDAALSFMDFVNQFSLDTDAIGIMNTPIVRDDKRPQVELATLAIKKTIDYRVSYYQSTVRELVRGLITSAFTNYQIANWNFG